jgi:hypothetical protein
MTLPMTLPMMFPNTTQPVARRRASRSGLDPSRMVTPSGTCYSGQNCDGKVLGKKTTWMSCCKSMGGKCWTSEDDGQDYKCSL